MTGSKKYIVKSSNLADRYYRRICEVFTTNKVHRLDESTVTKIAAGEVIERPASVVKELVENSIDSGATRIEIEIKNGGRQLIRVTDNGQGMDKEDAILAIERHTTSKITEPDELWRLKTLGFRGEALPSIAAVSIFEMITKTPDSEIGTSVEVRGGFLQRVKDVGAPDGTTIKAQELFFNTPARFKYLKTIPTEAGYISEIIARMALGFPEISFHLQHGGYELLFTPGNGNLYETVVAIFGKDVAKEMIEVNYEEHGLKMTGYIGKPSVARNNRNYEIFFVNRRFFHCRTLSAAVEKAFHTLLPIARYPFVILFLEIAPDLVDINAHPTKMEVRFSNDADLFKVAYNSIRKALKDSCLLSEWIASEEDYTTVVAPEHPIKMANTVNSESAVTTVAQTLDITYPEPNSANDVEQPILAIHEQSAVNMDYRANEPSVKSTFVDKSYYVFPKTISNTYIIAQDEKGLLFLDQHAAHERILYEQYMNKSKEFLGTQALLIPETVNLNYAQYKVVSERLSVYNDLGFELEAFGGQTIIIRGVPLTLINMDYRQIIIDFADQYINFETFKNPAELKESFITTMACRTAIKAGDSLNSLEMESLVRDLFRCDNPYTCPHGRPTVFRMNQEELAKKFLRR
jgi:DNA mismatch repair protein MutL